MNHYLFYDLSHDRKFIIEAQNLAEANIHKYLYANKPIFCEEIKSEAELKKYPCFSQRYKAEEEDK